MDHLRKWKNGQFMAIGVIALLLFSTFGTQLSQGTIDLQFLPLLPGTWFTLTIVAILTLMAIAAIVYEISGIIDSPNARSWARAQIYEAMLSIVIILVFLGFIFFFFLNPQTALQAVNLLPTSGAQSCAAAVDVFQIATCNLAVFNHYAFGVFAAIYFTTIYLGYTTGFQYQINYGLDTINTNFGVSASLPSIIPVDAETSFSLAFTAFLIMAMLNQVQLLIIAGSLFWLSFFVSIGLIARTFGFTRTFGGAMIALGIGIGLIFPLVVNLTYGFVNTELWSLGADSVPANLAYDMIGYMIGFLIHAVFSGSTACTGTCSLPSSNWVLALALTLAGLTFIPFLNFSLVDSFVVDFSKAIGERLDFMSMLVQIV